MTEHWPEHTHSAQRYLTEEIFGLQDIWQNEHFTLGYLDDSVELKPYYETKEEIADTEW